MKHPSLLALTLALAGALGASAEEYGTDHGRVRHVEPGVTLQRASETFAEEAAANTPFFPGDRVWTESNGRAEFQFPDGSLLRLDARSKLDYVNHDAGSREETVTLRLWSGGVILHVREGRGGGTRFEIEAPGGLVSVSERGVYRVDAESTETRLSVYEGEAVLDANRRRVTVEDGEAVSVGRGEGPDGPHRFDREALDEFGYWDRERTDAERSYNGRSARYLPAEVAPYASEFDAHGNWHYETEVGYVWAPSVSAGWQPYTNGRWAWTAYGWNFVPYEPWGWPVTHYGRWGFSVGLGWYWIPGRVWGPSWVSWAVGGDYVGWCPLGYRDRPVAGYGYAGSRGGGGGRHGGGPGWSFARRGDLSARDYAKRRVDPGTVDLSALRVTEAAHARPTRDLRALETAQARGTRRSVPRSGSVTGLPFAGGAREEGGAASRYRKHEAAPPSANPAAPSTANPAASPSANPDERVSRPRREAPPARMDWSEAAPRSEATPRGTRRPMPAAPPVSAAQPDADDRDSQGRSVGSEGRGGSRENRSGSPEGRGSGATPRESRPRDREPDRDAMRDLFRPLSEPRNVAPRGGNEGARPRSERPPTASEGSGSSRPERSRPEASAPRSNPPPRQEARPESRQEPRRESRPPQSRPRGGDAESRKPPR